MSVPRSGDKYLEKEWGTPEYVQHTNSISRKIAFHEFNSLLVIKNYLSRKRGEVKFKNAKKSADNFTEKKFYLRFKTCFKTTGR